MNCRAWLSLLGVLMLVNGSAVVAQESPKGETKSTAAKLPTPEEILRRYADAIGGSDAFSKHKSQHAKGTVQMPGQQITGNLEVYAMRPDKMAMKMDMPGVGEVSTVFDGTNGWMSTAVTGPMLLPDSMLKQVKAQADFDHALRSPGEYAKMEVAGKEEFGGEQCYKLNLEHKSGFKTTEYFSVSTGLQKGFVATQESPFGPVTATSVVNEYKKFGDVMMQSKVTQKVSGIETVTTISEMEFDKVDPAVFIPPAAVTALLEGEQPQK